MSLSGTKDCRTLRPGSVPGVSSRLAIFSLLGLLCVALSIPPAAPAADRIVSVTGRATMRVPNDSAVVGFGVVKERRNRAAALSETSRKLRAVIAAAQRIQGVGDGDVKTGRIYVRKVGRAGVYRASEGVAVTIHETANTGDLIEAGIRAGATGVSGPSFFVGDTEAAEANVLAAAFDKAKARAAVLAHQAGATLGPAIEIDEGEENIFPVNAGGKFEGSFFEETASAAPVEAPPPAPPPTKPGRTRVSARVHVIFELR